MSKLMKGLVAGLLVVGLLTVAGPARAQFADPLTLAGSGVLIPFFGAIGGDVSILEVASPNDIIGNPGLHFIFYNAACTRIESFPTAETPNHLRLYLAAASGPGAIVTGVDGLIAIAKDIGNGIDLQPLGAPGVFAGSEIHTRVYTINATTRRFRVLEPITVATAEIGLNLAVFNPLRSGATFFAPTDVAPFNTKLTLICPKDAIQSSSASATDASAFAVGRGFPNVNVVGFASSYPLGSLRARVYDLDETFLRDWQTSCDCLVTKVLSGTGALSTVYSAPNGTGGTYTEVETDGTNNRFFTGYKELTVAGSPELVFFGRLSNGNRNSLLGTLTPAR